MQRFKDILHDVKYYVKEKGKQKVRAKSYAKIQEVVKWWFLGSFEDNAWGKIWRLKVPGEYRRIDNDLKEIPYGRSEIIGLVEIQ